MAKLKSELELIRNVLKNNTTLKVVSATPDEIVLKFYGSETKSSDITGNITASYPDTPPVWFTDAEDTNVIQAVEMLGTTSGEDNQVLQQIRMLLKKLFQVKCLPEPVKALEQLKISSGPLGEQLLPSSIVAAGCQHMRKSISGEEMDEDQEDSDDEQEDFDYFEEEDLSEHDFAAGADKEKEGGQLDSKHHVILENLQKRLDGDREKDSSVSSSIEASKRLMKELKDIYMSDTFKNGLYSVSLMNENLYEWNVHLYMAGIDSDSPLYADMIKLKQCEDKDFIELCLTFKGNFPFDPPFARVIYPMIQRGHVTQGGAICMELLTKQGWSPAYTIEAVIMQVTATLTKGDARINIGHDPRGRYNLKNAQASYANMLVEHGKKGWGTLSKSDG